MLQIRNPGLWLSDPAVAAHYASFARVSVTRRVPGIDLGLWAAISNA